MRRMIVTPDTVTYFPPPNFFVNAELEIMSCAVPSTTSPSRCRWPQSRLPLATRILLPRPMRHRQLCARRRLLHRWWRDSGGRCLRADQSSECSRECADQPWQMAGLCLMQADIRGLKLAKPQPGSTRQVAALPLDTRQPPNATPERSVGGVPAPLAYGAAGRNAGEGTFDESAMHGFGADSRLRLD
ncbi:hypothetical protein SAMN05192544_1002310 [Paraburkholderia hospita]|nr:hypothetical protein SAMN05192544_1002310 [Paraburkholderia hospita]